VWTSRFWVGPGARHTRPWVRRKSWNHGQIIPV